MTTNTLHVFRTGAFGRKLRVCTLSLIEPQVTGEENARELGQFFWYNSMSAGATAMCHGIADKVEGLDADTLLDALEEWAHEQTLEKDE